MTAASSLPSQPERSPMPVLLHIDSSFRTADTSVSRQLTALFRSEWLAANPTGTVVYRDLVADPVPHLQHSEHLQGDEAPLRATLARELEQADLVLIGTPMHNFTVPSVLKAWIDHSIIMGRTGGGIGSTGTVAGKQVVVIASRGGGYSPGTPGEDKEFATSYLDAMLRGLFGMVPEFIVAELTLANSVPQLAHLKDLAKDSLDKARQEVLVRARAERADRDAA